MTNKKENPSKSDKGKVAEPSTAFKTVRVFSSFEEAAEFEAKQSAGLSYHDRLKHVEELRKRVFHQYLQEDGTWPPISKSFQIMKSHPYDPG